MSGSTCGTGLRVSWDETVYLNESPVGVGSGTDGESGSVWFEAPTPTTIKIGDRKQS